MLSAMDVYSNFGLASAKNLVSCWFFSFSRASEPHRLGEPGASVTVTVLGSHVRSITCWSTDHSIEKQFLAAIEPLPASSMANLNHLVGFRMSQSGNFSSWPATKQRRRPCPLRGPGVGCSSLHVLWFSAWAYGGSSMMISSTVGAPPLSRLRTCTRLLLHLLPLSLSLSRSLFLFLTLFFFLFLFSFPFSFSFSFSLPFSRYAWSWSARKSSGCYRYLLASRTF